MKKKAGRPAIEPTEEQIELTTQYTDIFRVGYKRCAESLKKRGIHISQNTVHKIYDNQSLFLHEPRKKKIKTYTSIFCILQRSAMEHRSP